MRAFTAVKLLHTDGGAAAWRVDDGHRHGIDARQLRAEREREQGAEQDGVDAFHTPPLRA